MANEKSANEMTVEEQIKAVELQTAKMNLKIAKQNIVEFEEKEENRARVTAIRVDQMKKQQDEAERRQLACKHKTGGKGKPGFLHGDGSKGYCVLHFVLPTGELYMLCTRCQKEWHHPNWTIKMQIFFTGRTTLTKSAYAKQLAEYAEAIEWGHEYTELAEASQFRIPILQRIDVSQVPLAPEPEEVEA